MYEGMMSATERFECRHVAEVSPAPFDVVEVGGYRATSRHLASRLVAHVFLFEFLIHGQFSRHRLADLANRLSRLLRGLYGLFKRAVWQVWIHSILMLAIFNPH